DRRERAQPSALTRSAGIASGRVRAIGGPASAARPAQIPAATLGDLAAIAPSPPMRRGAQGAWGSQLPASIRPPQSARLNPPPSPPTPPPPTPPSPTPPPQPPRLNPPAPPPPARPPASNAGVGTPSGDEDAHSRR